MRFFNAGVSATLMLATTAPAAAQPAAPAPDINLQIRNIRGNLYMIDDVRGANSDAGGNVTALTGDDGVVLGDSMVAVAAPEIPAVLETVTRQPVRFVINTHNHPDHRGGLPVFAPTSTLIAHPNTYALMSSTGRDGSGPVAPPAAWPDLLVPDRITLHQNGETIDVRHYPRAHTDSDLVIFYRNANVVQLGDTYFAGMFPFVDSNGHIDGVIALMEDVLAQTNAETLFVPGHGPLSTQADLAAWLSMLKETRAIAAEGIRQGRTVAQIVDDDDLVRRLEPWSHGYINMTEYFEHLYEVLNRG